MTDWLQGLAVEAASALVGAAASDAWTHAKAGIIGIFTNAGRRQDVVTRWSDETAATIAAAPVEERQQRRQQLAPVWASRLADLLDEYPELRDDLQEWAEQVRPKLPATSQIWMQNYIARDRSTQFNAPNGSITVNNPNVTPES